MREIVKFGYLAARIGALCDMSKSESANRDLKGKNITH